MEFLFNAIRRLADAESVLCEVVSGSQLLTRKMASDMMGDLSDLVPGMYTWVKGEQDGTVEAFAMRRTIRGRLNVYRSVLGRALSIYTDSRPTTSQEFTDAVLLAIDQVFGTSAEALRLKADINTLKITMPDEDLTTSIQARGRRVISKRLGCMEEVLVPLMPANRVASQFDVAGYLSNTYNEDVRLDSLTGVNGAGGTTSGAVRIYPSDLAAKQLTHVNRVGLFEYQLVFDADATVVILKANKRVMIAGTLSLTREQLLGLTSTPTRISRTAVRSEILDNAFCDNLVVSAGVGGYVRQEKKVKWVGGVPERVVISFHASVPAGNNLSILSLAYTAAVYPDSAVGALLTLDKILPLEKGISPFTAIGADAELRSFVGTVPPQYLEYMQASAATSFLNELESYDSWAEKTNDPVINKRTLAVLLNQYCLKRYKTEVGPTNNLYSFVGRPVWKVDFWLSQMPAVFTQSQWSDIYCQFVSVIPIYAHLAISSMRYADKWSETEIGDN